MRSPRARLSGRTFGFEQLEARLTMSAVHGSLEPASVELHAAKKKLGNSYPTGLTPAETRSYYGFDKVSFNGVAADGAGQTIAIVVARNNPNIANDLAVFDQTFGLPAPPSFKVVNQYGGSKLPKNNKGWASEAALDVQWAHAIAPGANILLVEAKNDSMLNFIEAIDYARNVPGVTVVSVSAAGPEFKQEALVDSLFTTPPGHEGVTFVFAAGDDGGVAMYPSSSPNVLSVGGTTLYQSSNAQWHREEVWNYGGGGDSLYEGVPSYQAGLGLTSRGTPDVAYNADPYTGFSVYDSYAHRGWVTFGGTSAGAPQWAALVAIANQGRELAGKAPLASAQAALYAMPSRDFHDITAGHNMAHFAGAGYDLASGLGSPIADRLIPDLVAFNGSTEFTVGLPPVVAKSGKSKHRFAAGIDSLARSLESGSGNLRTVAASSISVAYTRDAGHDEALALVDVVPGTTEGPPLATPSLASGRLRLSSARRSSGAPSGSVGDDLSGVDAFFAGLGAGTAVA